MLSPWYVLNKSLMNYVNKLNEWNLVALTNFMIKVKKNFMQDYIKAIHLLLRKIPAFLTYSRNFLNLKYVFSQH